MLDRLARMLRNVFDDDPAPRLPRLRWPVFTTSKPGAATRREAAGEEDPLGPDPRTGAAAPAGHRGGRRRSAA